MTGELDENLLNLHTYSCVMDLTLCGGERHIAQHMQQWSRNSSSRVYSRVARRDFCQYYAA